VAEHVVTCEPVSALNPWCSGKFTGLFVILSLVGMPNVLEVPIPSAYLDQNLLEKSRSVWTKEQAEIAFIAESTGQFAPF
jgi:hypothetical protein